MPQHSNDRIAWVARHIIPVEPQVRAHLRAAGASVDETDDLIQDAYCRLAAMDSVAPIKRPGAYFMQTVKNLYRDRLRRAKVIRFEQFTENTEPFVTASGTNPEIEVGARHELQLVDRVLATLPERCRAIFTLKRIEGLSQKDIAQSLGVTETIVENDVRKAVRALQAALRGDHAATEDGASIAAEQRQAS